MDELPNMVWLEIDLFNNELPLRVADSAAELAKWCGVAEGTVRTSASRARRGRRGRYVSVWIGEEAPA